MPHFTLPFVPGIGPVLTIAVGVSTPRYGALKAAGQTPPRPIGVPFLIDTGASHTWIDHVIIIPLGLSPTGSTTMHTPSTGAVPIESPTYDVSLYIHHDENSKFVTLLPVTAVDFSAQLIKGLLGRDFLRSCLFVYDGLAETHSIAF